MSTNEHDLQDEQPVVSDSDSIADFGDGEPVQTQRPDTVENEQQEPEPVIVEEERERPLHNLKTSPTVNYSQVVYRLDTRSDAKRGPAIILVPKRLNSLDQNKEAWDVDEKNPDNEIGQYIQRWIYGLNNQHLTSFLSNEKPLFTETLDDPNSSWSQGYMNSQGKTVYLRKPELSVGKTRRSVSGSAAVDLVSSAIGLGVSTRIPLPHTGIHVALGARSTQDYINLDTMLTQDKNNAGRNTVGVIYQNSHIPVIRCVWDFIYDSIRSVNRQNSEDIDLGDEIRILDLPILQWGMACTMFPDGYPLDLPCSAGPLNCKHVEHVLLDLDKLLWINTNGLSTAQKEKLGNPSHKFSKEDIEGYQAAGEKSFVRSIRINERLQIIFKVPTVNEYLAAGEQWLASITDSAINLFGNSEENEERIRQYVDRIIETNSLREYSHWIKAIIVDDYAEIEDRDAIANTLNTLSNDMNLIPVVLAEIQKFIDDCTVALIAIPNFACPKCEKDYVTDEFSKHPELIPLDMLKHFFTLKDLRLARPIQDMSA